ncbi:MAG: hypothetical protein EA379_00085 [Phycisphaerales bacterium]|nr:MAG: hypothetical protein EA379_00085 [Phycisphaerales bacterium]
MHGADSIHPAGHTRGGATTTDTLRTALARLNAGARVAGLATPPAAPKDALADGVQGALTARAGVAAQVGLTEVSALLSRLESIVARAGEQTGATAAERRETQSEVDAIIASIDRIAGASGAGALTPGNSGPGYEVTNVNEHVESLRITGAKVGPGETIDADIVVTQSAQQGALALDFGGPLNLGGADANFIFELGGVLGKRTLSFASGTTLSTIADTLNTLTEVTGVHGTLREGRIWLESPALGSDQFVSVRVIDDGGAQGAGIYTVNDDNVFDIGGPGSTLTAFADAGAGVVGEGRDLVATVNGAAATAQGGRLTFASGALSFIADLGVGVTQQLGAVRLFTLEGVEQQRAGAGAPAPAQTLADLGSGRALNLIDGDLAGARSVVGAAAEGVRALLEGLAGPGARIDAAAAGDAALAARERSITDPAALAATLGSLEAQRVLTLLG